MEPVVPETKVLAIASHVVYGHVGNTMASVVMQSLGCDVSALNTVQFSNHTGYGRFKGTKALAEEISDIYAGLKENGLTDFDILLSGYAPSADAVSAVGAIARDLKLQTSTRPGSFFWVLDPVMGDEGKLYVSEGCVPIYKQLLRDADLILPNQFELELLSGVQINSTQTIQEAIEKLHRDYQIPHIIVTSIHESGFPNTISVIGSTARSDWSPRIFKISVPSIDCYFSGTGDMFAGLTVVRLREAITKSDLLGQKSWVSPDEVPAKLLPLARATEKVLESMQAVLLKTKKARDRELARHGGPAKILEAEGGIEGKLRLKTSKAAEVRVVRCLEDLKNPANQFKAVSLQDEERKHDEDREASTFPKTVM